MLRIGVDIGGTFTDFVIYDSDTGEVQTFKLLSSPDDPALAVLRGLKSLRLTENAAVIHGSTVATNALLERKGANLSLITTRGFRDVIEIGRQNRPSLYNWNVEKPAPLVPRDRRFEVEERVDYSGAVLQELDITQLHELVEAILSTQSKSVALCLLFSFLHPQHEQTIAGLLREKGVFVSASSEILPQYREYERTSTTVVNAYVSPVLDRYLSHLESALPSMKLSVMQSNGGMIGIPEARRAGVRCILSGPAGGVIAAEHITRFVNPHGVPLKLLTFDMGGTSTDVALIDGEPKLTTDSVVAGCPIAIPLLDIHTIGAGGGSIAAVDVGGALQVGPQSAGADPGPACYGHGELATVTDANVFLGRIAPDFPLGGEIQLQPERASRALAGLADQLSLTLEQAALGVIEVVNAHMERALRVISIERGYDPRDFTLFSFGGAGGLHAVELARRLQIPRVFISPLASTLSAFGMLVANVVKDYSLTVMLSGEAPAADLEARFAPLLIKAQQEVIDEGIPPKDVVLQRFADLRYQGQSYELTIPFSQNLLIDFHQAHQQAYGYNAQNIPVEIVNLRVRAVGLTSTPQLKRVQHSTTLPPVARLAPRRVVFAEGSQEVSALQGELLSSGSEIAGPALIIRSDTSILLENGDVAEVDAYQNLLVKVRL